MSEKMEMKFEEQYPLRKNEQVYDHSSTVRGRENRLFEASMNGNVNSLKQLMAEDPLALARSSVACFNETPLHIAAMLGHVDFAKTILNHKPDMAMAMDFQGRSPLHLAAANGYTQIVNMMLLCHPSACLIRDEDGRTPLHLAVMKGHVEIIRELVEARPEETTATKYKLDHGETILHSAVKHNRLEALKLLVESAVKETEFINAKDDYGNTVLHTATTLKQLETIRYLLGGSMVEVNAVNGSGMTALDVIEIMPRDLKSMEIRESLSKAGALRSTNLNIPPSNREYDIAVKIQESQLDSADHVPPRVASVSGRKTNKADQETWFKNNREVLMVTAGVIAAMAYQAGLNPPSGIWQDQTNDHDAGTSIMSDYHPNGYRAFWISNTMAFVTSLSTIFLLVSGITMKRKVMMAILMVIMWITLTCMTIAYSISVMAISSFDEKFAIPVVIVSVFTWFGLVGIVCLRHFFRFLVKYEKKCAR